MPTPAAKRSHFSLRRIRPHRARGFTLAEVMISILLIVVSMGSILMMNVRAAKILRASREVAATSQILQQRVEMARDQPWSGVTSAKAFAVLMQTPTDSEAEMTDPQFSEQMRVTVPKPTADGLAETSRSFSILRSKGRVTVEQADDFSTEPTLLFQGTVTWRDTSGVHQRVLRTVVCRYGLTHSGIVGTVIGRPGSAREASAP